MEINKSKKENTFDRRNTNQGVSLHFPFLRIFARIGSHLLSFICLH